MARSRQQTPENLQALVSEQRNQASADLDRMSAVEIARTINREDGKVVKAVEKALPEIARAIDTIADALREGGRLIYVGTGTSGRLGALDASECPPTFGTDSKQVQYVIAGGDRALAHATEASEDSREDGITDLRKRKPTKKDVVVGIAASGRTPYTIAALEYARKRGAKTVSVACNRNTPLGETADTAIVAEVGPEVLSGSTRMKSGTAQKMILNMLTTGAMARLGYVYGNLMVRVALKNVKLVERGVSILSEAAGVDRDKARAALETSGNSVPVALVMLKCGVSRVEAQKRLKAAAGNVRRAIGHARRR
jgi:N-acetylmuramic acid 6-phosphate etherase